MARQRGLSPAARQTGLSPATLGRRMTTLERTLGHILFQRWPTGYSLTEAGQALLAQAEAMERAANAVDRWREGLAAGRTVRISAGSWTARFLSRHIASVRRDGDDWTLDLGIANTTVDIGRRHADIGIRNRRPEEPWLAGRRVGRVAFASYGRADLAETDLPWIGVSGGTTPSAQWLAELPGAAVPVHCSDPRGVMDLVLAGAGRAVFPCFVGDAEPPLARLGEPIAALTSDQWLVVHHDERHDPAVRTAADRIAALLTAHRALFAGESAVARDG